MSFYSNGVIGEVMHEGIGDVVCREIKDYLLCTVSSNYFICHKTQLPDYTKHSSHSDTLKSMFPVFNI